MSATRDPNEPIRSWLILGPTELPATVRETIVEGTRSMGQAPAGRTRRPRAVLALPLSRFQALGVAATVLLMVIIGASLIGSRSDEPSPQVSTPTATALDEPPVPRAEVTSSLYGYRVRPQVDATMHGATARWPGAGPWDTAPTADRFESAGQDFTVAVGDVAPETTAAAFVTAHGMARREFGTPNGETWSCRRGQTMIPGIGVTHLRWIERTIAGHPGLVRAACGFVDAVVIVDGRAWVISSFTKLAHGADLDAFDAVAETIELPAATFSSTVYGYRITPRSDAVARLATERWDGTGPWDTAPTADRFLSPGQSFTITAVGVEAGTTAAGFVTANELVRDEFRFARAGEWSCRRFGGGMAMVGVERLRWQDRSIAGHPAVARAVCGYLDAVVVVGTKAWVISSFTTPQPGANLEAFDAVADTLEFPTD
jgi:hypothetical protein